MGLSQCLLLLFMFLFKGCNTSATSHEPCYCHDEESSALLQFKQSFTIDASASGEGAYPKVSSWNPAHGGNNTCCCTWDGVECDEETSHVIGLDLSSSCLYGSINSNSSLFRLVHLQRLSLADNHFNYSQIPTSIRNFPRLTHLDLSASVFSGRVPSELSQLVKLSSLDLSFNIDPSSDQGLLKLDGSDFRSLVQNLTSLQKFHLSYINISSPVPDSMANLSFLTSLSLIDCEIFGPIPASLANLTRLTHLALALNNFDDGPLSWVGKLTKLTELHLRGINLIGDIPSSLENLTQLTDLDLSYNQLTGPIPSWVGNLSRLVQINLGANELHSSIPESLFNLVDLKWLSLVSNALTGVVDIFKLGIAGTSPCEGWYCWQKRKMDSCPLTGLEGMVGKSFVLAGLAGTLGFVCELSFIFLAACVLAAAIYMCVLLENKCKQSKEE